MPLNVSNRRAHSLDRRDVGIRQLFPCSGEQKASETRPFLTLPVAVSTILSERSTRKVAKRKYWTVTVGGTTHKVEVRRKPWLAIGEIKVDDKVVSMFAAKAMSITLFNYRQQPFWIDDQQFSVIIKPNFFGYNFDLTRDGELIEPDPSS